MKKILLLIFAIILTISTAQTCTIAVISGKYTSDGRPLLWKNRDTHQTKNILMFFHGKKFDFIGLVNANDTTGSSVWIGVNSAGFAIMNSASYNLNINDTVKQTGNEGKIMKLALETCATVQDFENLLKKLPKPTRIESNFGVIDAHGGAAMFEVGNWKYVKFDANDPKVAPFGYIIRTNYSFTGKLGTESSGYIRYNTVNQLFYSAASTSSLNAQFIIQNVTRELYNSLTKDDLYKKYANIPQNTPTFTWFHDFVPRKFSASSVVIQGVKNGENPLLTTMWTVVGFPLCSITIPVWVYGQNNFPQILHYNKKLKNSPLCHAALTLKKKVFPIIWGKFASEYYININALINADGTGIIQKIRPYENYIFRKTYSMLSSWRKNNQPDKKQMLNFYSWINAYVKNMYLSKFHIRI
jgi:hypothetical protein